MVKKTCHKNRVDSKITQLSKNASLHDISVCVSQVVHMISVQTFSSLCYVGVTVWSAALLIISNFFVWLRFPFAADPRILDVTENARKDYVLVALVLLLPVAVCLGMQVRSKLIGIEQLHLMFLFTFTFILNTVLYSQHNHFAILVALVLLSHLLVQRMEEHMQKSLVLAALLCNSVTFVVSVSTTSLTTFIRGEHEEVWLYPSLTDDDGFVFQLALWAWLLAFFTITGLGLRDLFHDENDPSNLHRATSMVGLVTLLAGAVSWLRPYNTFFPSDTDNQLFLNILLRISQLALVLALNTGLLSMQRENRYRRFSEAGVTVVLALILLCNVREAGNTTQVVRSVLVAAALLGFSVVTRSEQHDKAK
jgi:hypothetical protein